MPLQQKRLLLPVYFLFIYTICQRMSCLVNFSLKPQLDHIYPVELRKARTEPSFRNITAFFRSVNEVICHGIPDKRPLESGDIVNRLYLLCHAWFFIPCNFVIYQHFKAPRRSSLEPKSIYLDKAYSQSYLSCYKLF